MLWVGLVLAAVVLILAWPHHRSNRPLIVVCDDGEGLEGVIRHAAASGRRIYVRDLNLDDESAAILAILEADIALVKRVDGDIEDVLEQSLAPVVEVTRLGPGVDVAAVIRELG